MNNFSLARDLFLYENPPDKYFQTFLTSFLFLYFSSMLVWAGYIYSESGTISTSSDVLLGFVSLFSYPLIFSLISSTIFSFVYFVIKKRITC